MRTLALMLLDGRGCRQIDDVTSLIAADASGQFGLQPGHVALVTVLEPGLFRYRRLARAEWSWGACVGGLLACESRAGRTEVRIVSGRFLEQDRPEALEAALDALLARERSLRLSTRESQALLERALVKRLQQLGQPSP